MAQDLTHAKTLPSEKTFREASQGPILKICVSWEYSGFEQCTPAESTHSFTERLLQKEVSEVQKTGSVPELWKGPQLSMCKAISTLENTKH